MPKVTIKFFEDGLGNVWPYTRHHHGGIDADQIALFHHLTGGHGHVDFETWPLFETLTTAHGWSLERWDNEKHCKMTSPA